MDVVVPQDVAITVERRLVVILADVVRLRQFIVVGRTIVAIVDDDVVLVAIDERRVGRHIARIFLDRAIDRLDALAADREFGLLDRRAVVEREGARIFKTVVLLVLFAEAVERDHRVIGILSCILGDDAFRVARQGARTRDRQVTRTVTIDAREDCLAEICFRAVDRRVRCVRDEVVDVVFRDVQRRDRCRAIEVRDFVVLQTVGAFALKSIVADILRPFAIRAVKRCIVRVVHATECRIQSRLCIAIRDAGCIAVTILRFVELRAIDRRRIANLNGQVSLLNMQVRCVRRNVVVLQIVDARRDVIVTNIVRLRITEVTVRRIRQVHDRLIVAIRQALDIRRERLVDRAIRRRLVVRIDEQCCLIDVQVRRIRLDVVVLQRVDARRDVIVTNVVRLRVTEVTVRRIRQVDDRLIVAIRQALDIRRERLVDRAVRRRLVVRVDDKSSLLQINTTRGFCYQLIVLIQKIL